MLKVTILLLVLHTENKPSAAALEGGQKSHAGTLLSNEPIQVRVIRHVITRVGGRGRRVWWCFLALEHQHELGWNECCYTLKSAKRGSVKPKLMQSY